MTSPYYASSDLASFFVDAPSRIAIGSVTLNCWRRDLDGALGDPNYGDDATLGHTIEVLVLTAGLTGQALDAVVTLDGKPYQIRNSVQVGDGAFTRLYVA